MQPQLHSGGDCDKRHQYEQIKYLAFHIDSKNIICEIIGSNPVSLEQK